MKSTGRKIIKKQQETEAFKEIVRTWAAKLKVQPTQIRVQKMRHKWASCSPKGWVSFGKDLLAHRRDFQEYVIVHELLHLRVPNHGRLFKSLMSLYLPDWEQQARRAPNDAERAL